MGELFRSEEMVCIQLFIQYEAAHDSIHELGKLGMIQFNDLNPEVNSFQKSFVTDIKRADEMERKLRYFRIECKKEKIDINPVVHGEGNIEKHEKIDTYESRFEDLEKELTQLNSNSEILQRDYNELVEMMHVLEKDATFFAEAEGFGYGLASEVDEEEDVRRPLMKSGAQGEQVFSKAVQLGFISGVVKREKMANFERVLWRATRGNLFMKVAEIEQPIRDPSSTDGKLVDKNVFVIFFQGDKSQLKIKKICESFGANLYRIPENSEGRRNLLTTIKTRIEDLSVVIARGSAARRKLLIDIAARLEVWRLKILHEKAIYNTLNQFLYDVGKRCLIGEGWAPTKSLSDIEAALRRGNQHSGAQIPSILTIIRAKDTPPTFFRTNKYTRTFQEIIEAYGVARYREINPSTFSIITFPFLFAVMFGDVGHGIMLTLFALVLLWFEAPMSKMKLNEMIAMCFSGRYLLLLMGLFSIYTGALYNECFSIPLAWTGTNWNWPLGYNGSQDVYASVNSPQNPVYFGVDYVWKNTKNELTFYNSLKMKLSVIFGVTQMTVGIALSAINAFHFRKPLDFFFQFLPQIIFLESLFGYLVFLVIFKWWIPWVESANTADAPFLLTTMINIFLHPTQAPDYPFFPGQRLVQMAIIVTAVLMIPLMLLPKPLILKLQHEKKGYVQLQEGNHNHHEEQAGAHGDHDGEDFDFSEVFVHQIIHTIEFVLGALSNTASYLRLWALSLAHSELSTVFWELILVRGLSSSAGSFMQIPFIIIAFAVWAGITFGVLLVMEALSAFLHALRLHWVEFMNKFYFADGRKFEPFSYLFIQQKAEEEDTELDTNASTEVDN